MKPKLPYEPAEIRCLDLSHADVITVSVPTFGAMEQGRDTKIYW